MESVKFFTSINLCSRYWQCYIANEDIPKTTFLMIYNLYKWVVMPMGVTNAPTTFMQTMNNLFFDVLDFSMAVFLDSIIKYSHMVKKYFTLQEKVLAHLDQYIFYSKLKKYRLLCNNTIFLSFNITPKSMCISDLKV